MTFIAMIVLTVVGIALDFHCKVLLLWIFYVFFCFVFAMPLYVSVYMCLVVISWERADLLALVCGVLL